MDNISELKERIAFVKKQMETVEDECRDYAWFADSPEHCYWRHELVDAEMRLEQACYKQRIRYIRNRELKERLTDFIEKFEAVFRDDWEFTTSCLASDEIHNYIAPSGDFLNPEVRDEYNNWGNRGSLLNAYRLLIEAMQVQGIYRETFLSNMDSELPF